MKRVILTLITLTCIAQGVLAANTTSKVWSFVPAQTAAQMNEVKLLERSSFKEALDQWTLAFPGRGFGDSPSGRALYAYLVFKSDMPFLGVETLFNVSQPQMIDPRLKDLWNKTAKSHPAWQWMNINWTPSWTKFFNKNIQNTSRAWQMTGIESSKSEKSAQTLLSELDSKSPEAAWVLWQLALYHGLNNQTKVASTELQKLLDSDEEVVGQDQIFLTVARLLFQDGKFQNAISYDDMVSKSSDYWLQAVEEKAWAYMRLNQDEKALAQVQTLKADLFTSQVAAEPYFLDGLAKLRLCDYYGIFKMIKDFKAKYRNRIIELQKLSDSGTSIAMNKAIDNFIKGEALTGLGDDMANLPQAFNRDYRLLQLARVAQEAASELNSAPEDLKPVLADRVNTAKTQMAKRFQVLAADDVKTTSKILQKMNLLDVEAIERTHVKQSLVDNLKKSESSSANLEFPDEGEGWVDELDHFQVDAKLCAKTSRVLGAKK